MNDIASAFLAGGEVSPEEAESLARWAQSKLGDVFDNRTQPFEALPNDVSSFLEEANTIMAAYGVEQFQPYHEPDVDSIIYYINVGDTTLPTFTYRMQPGTNWGILEFSTLADAIKAQRDSWRGGTAFESFYGWQGRGQISESLTPEEADAVVLAMLSDIQEFDNSPEDWAALKVLEEMGFDEIRLSTASSVDVQNLVRELVSQEGLSPALAQRLVDGAIVALGEMEDEWLADGAEADVYDQWGEY